MHDDLSGRVAVVTGASIGAATARLFAVCGATVVVGYHRGARRRRTAARRPCAVQITIDDGASVRAAADAVAQRFGRCLSRRRKAWSSTFAPSAPFPKFVIHLSTHLHELRKQRGTSVAVQKSATFLRRVRIADF